MNAVIHQLIHMFCIILFGFCIKQFHLMDPGSIKQLNKLVIDFLFPINLMLSVMKMDIQKLLNPPFLLATVIAFALTFAIAYGVAFLVSKDRIRRNSIGLLIFIPNFVVIGVPMLESLVEAGHLTPEANEFAVAALFIGLLLHNGLAVFTLERETAGEVSLPKLLLRTISNPMLVGVFAGFFLNLVGVANFGPFQKPLSALGGLAPVLVLLTIGSTLNFHIDKKELGQIVVTNAAKMLVVPIVIYLVLGLIGAGLNEKLVLTILSASPMAIYVCNMQTKYEVDAKFGSSAVILSMLLYLGTMPLLMGVLL